MRHLIALGCGLTSNWEGGFASPFEADFEWMYDDGFGSDNEDCTAPTDPGCWGHRHDILWPLDAPAVMGAAEATLTLQGPNGSQPVALSKPGAATLRAAANRRTITAGRAATITGTLLRSAGLGAPGQTVALSARPGGTPLARGLSATRTLRAT